MAISGEVRSRLFGQPGKVDRVTYETPWGPKVSIHPQILRRFRAACELAHRTCTWRPQRVDSYNNRPIRGKSGIDPDDWSLHAWALAFDFFATPPGVPPPGGVWTPDDGVPADFAACFTRYGFRWGATFSRKDVPHIEWADGIPAPLAEPGDTTTEDDMAAVPQGEWTEVLEGMRTLVWPAGTAPKARHPLYNLALWTLQKVGVDQVDEQEIISGILAGLSAETIGKAVPEAIAREVVDILLARLED